MLLRLRQACSHYRLAVKDTSSAAGVKRSDSALTKYSFFFVLFLQLMFESYLLVVFVIQSIKEE
jgi:hypothetical protein